MVVKNADRLIQDAGTPKLGKARRILLELVDSAIKAGNSSSSMRKWVRIVAVGGGKAGAAMAITREQILGDRLTNGIVNILAGTAPRKATHKIKFVEAGHPILREGN